MENKNKIVKIHNVNNLSLNEKLQLIFNYAKENYLEINTDDNNEADILFRYMIDLFGYNEFPMVVSDKTFGRINEKILYRGVQKKDYIANILCDYNYHYGTGFLSGLYSSPSKKIANYYAFRRSSVRAEKEYDKELIFKFKLFNANICTEKFVESLLIKLLNDDEIYDILYQWKHHVFKNEQEKIVNEKYITDLANSDESTMQEVAKRLLTLKKFLLKIKNKSDLEIITTLLNRDLSKFAVILGFDAMSNLNQSVIIYNRAKVVVSKSEFARFVEPSKKYNLDGTINFEKQLS